MLQLKMTLCGIAGCASVPGANQGVILEDLVGSEKVLGLGESFG